MNPADLQARLGQTQRMLAHSDIAGASAVLEALLIAAPGEPNTLHALAAVKQRAGDPVNALQCFD